MLNLSREQRERESREREKGDFSIWPSQLGLELTRPAQLPRGKVLCAGLGPWDQTRLKWIIDFIISHSPKVGDVKTCTIKIPVFFFMPPKEDEGGNGPFQSIHPYILPKPIKVTFYQISQSSQQLFEDEVSLKLNLDLNSRVRLYICNYYLNSVR